MSAATSRHPKYRTKLCRNLANGGCSFGDKCSFIHPTPKIPPLPSLVNWNAFLTQLFALSNKPSPPCLQATPSIDEDVSPPASLLLSASETSSPEQIPQTGWLKGQKRYPCRHFLRTGGWCPVGTKCKFFHDVAALPDTVPLPSAGVKSSERSSPSETDAYRDQGRTIGGGVLMGMQAPSSPFVSEKFPESPRRAQVQLPQSYQPVYWPNYTWQAYRPYYATVPATNTVPVPVTTAPSPHVHFSDHPLPQTQAHNISSNETQNYLSSGAYELDGTTYFPPSVPPVPAPAPVTYPAPVYPAPYSHTLAPPYPYYAPPAPTSHYSISHHPTDTNFDFDPFHSDPIMPSELPVIPQCEDYQIPAMQHVALPLPSSSPSAPGGDLISMSTTGKPAAHEFPYQPPKNQRAGHARRISVNVKKHHRASSG